MAMPRISDLDFQAAVVHGRRSRLAEAERLDALCRVGTVEELAEAVFHEPSATTCADFQRRLLRVLFEELSEIAATLDAVRGGLLGWILFRFQVENLKLILRGFMTHTKGEVVREHLLPLPDPPAFDIESLLGARNLQEFIHCLPKDRLANALTLALRNHGAETRPFFFEAVMDRDYLQELLRRVSLLSGDDLELARPLVEQEVNAFLLMLAVRARFNYGIRVETLSPFYIRAGGTSLERFNWLLQAASPYEAAILMIGRALDDMPSVRASDTTDMAALTAELERLAQERFLHLSNRAFRRSPVGFGALLGYAGMRRVEVANLITISEGIRAHASFEEIRSHVVPRQKQGVDHV